MKRKNFELLQEAMTSRGNLERLSEKTGMQDTELRPFLFETESFVEEAMRECLRVALTESQLDSDEVVNGINMVENASFSDEEKALFISETIDPVIQISGISERRIRPYSQGVVLPVFEVAAILEDATEGDLTVDDLPVDGGGDEGEEEEVGEEAFEDDVDEDSYEGEVGGEPDYDETPGGDLESTAGVEGAEEQAEIAEALIDEVFDDYGIEDPTLQEAIILEASLMLEEIGFERIVPSMDCISELVVVHNTLAEQYGYPSTAELVEFAAQIRESKQTGTRNIRPYIRPLISEAKAVTGSVVLDEASLKGAWDAVKGAPSKAWKGVTRGGTAVGGGARWAGKKVWSAGGAAKKAVGQGAGYVGNIVKKNKVAAGVGGAVTVAAIAIAALAAYKKFKSNKCRGLTGNALKKCKIAASDEALRTLKAQERSCGAARNPQRCQAGVRRQMEVWKARKADAAKG